jgi:hypothetical protein
VSDPDLVELAMQVVRQTCTETGEPSSFAAADDSEIRDPAPPEAIEVERPPAPGSAAFARPAPVKEKKAANELAAMILDDLSQIEGCPKRGVKVTVYGSNPWNSWLSFGAKAGPVPNKTDLQGFCDIISERLKRLYDVSS